MHLISFDASARQLGKLKKGLPVRIKKGRGFNLVVNPTNYNLVSRAFRKNKGLEIKLSPEELETNENLSPEEHEDLKEGLDDNLFQHLPFAEGGNIFKKMRRGLNSKSMKKLGRELKPISREAKSIAREIAHEKIADLHQQGADAYGDNERMSRLLNVSANTAHSRVGKGLLGKLKKASKSKSAKSLGRDLKPLSREAKTIGREMAHEKIAEMHQHGAERYGDNERMSRLINVGAHTAHNKVGNGLYAGARGRGMSVHEALKLANLATASANHQLSKIHNQAVHSMATQPTIKSSYDDSMAPPSRGYGLHNHHNLIRGRGSLLTQDDHLPPALQSQPFGANFHMQYQLPPQYKKFNNGTEVEGRGMFL